MNSIKFVRFYYSNAVSKPIQFGQVKRFAVYSDLSSNALILGQAQTEGEAWENAMNCVLNMVECGTL